MYALNSFKFLDSVVTPTTSNALSIGRASQLVIQVSGTSTSFSLVVEGKVDEIIAPEAPVEAPAEAPAEVAAEEIPVEEAPVMTLTLSL